jgi:hypothetical protein
MNTGKSYFPKPGANPERLANRLRKMTRQASFGMIADSQWWGAVRR